MTRSIVVSRPFVWHSRNWPDPLEDAAMRMQAQQAARNVVAQLDADTIDRLAAYELIADAADIPAANKLAMALSGWLMGAEYLDSESDGDAGAV